MKKIIQLLLIIILLLIIGSIIVFVFNPGGLRDQAIANAINNYLSKNIEGYQAIPEGDRIPYEEIEYNNPLIPDTQEKALYDMGVDTKALPSEITPAMAQCFEDKLGKTRTQEIINGAIPSAMDVFKAKNCL